MQVHHILENAAKNYPNKDAVWDNNLWFQYSEIDSKASKLCSFLIINGINIGDRIALIHENSIDYIIAYFGILKAGGVVVGLNPNWSDSFLLYSLRNSYPKLIILSSQILKSMQPIIQKFDKSVGYILTDSNATENFEISETLFDIYKCEEEVQSVRTIDLDIAEIVYTSGSTGKPKGATLTHLNLISNQYSIAKYLKLTCKDRIMVILPFYYIYGKSLLLTHFLICGSVVINNRFTYPNLVIDTMQKTGVTGFAGVPSTYSILLNRSKIFNTKIESLRYVTQAGGAMAPTLQKEVVRAFNPAVLYIMYGATEAAPRLSYLDPKRLDQKLGSIGVPVDNVELKILDVDGKEVLIGEVGEIAARGSNIMVGYWNDSNATKAVFKNGYYLTGDLGKQDEEGYFYVVGRKKDFIKSKGFKVSAKMVEETIMELQCVQEVAVIGIKDKNFGEAIKAFIILSKNASIDSDKIKKYLSEKLAPYEVPQYVEFVNHLPKNKSGKILKTKLRK